MTTTTMVKIVVRSSTYCNCTRRMACRLCRLVKRSRPNFSHRRAALVVFLAIVKMVARDGTITLVECVRDGVEVEALVGATPFTRVYGVNTIVQATFEGNIFPPLPLASLVIALVDSKTTVLQHGIVFNVDDGTVWIDLLGGGDDDDDGEHKRVCVPRCNVFVLASGDILKFMDLLDRECGAGVVGVHDTYQATLVQREFEARVAEIEDDIVSGRSTFVTLLPYDRLGNSISFSTGDSLLNDFVCGDMARDIDGVRDMHLQCTGSNRQLTTARMLFQLHRRGAVLICLGEHKSATLSDTTVATRWFVAGRESAAQTHLDIVRHLLANVIDQHRRQVALFALADAFTDAMLQVGRAQQGDDLRRQLYTCLAAGEGAEATAKACQWSWPRLAPRLAFVRDLFWQWRVDSVYVEHSQLVADIVTLLPQVASCEYTLSSDEYKELINEFYLTFGELATDKTRRHETQKIANEHATSRAAARYVEKRWLEIFGENRHIHHTTIYRRLTSKYKSGSEAARHRNVLLDARPVAAGRGDIGNKCNAHYANALLRSVREVIGNFPQRADDVKLVLQRPALLVSRDDKAKLYLDGRPVINYNPRQLHLVSRTNDGSIVRAKPVLPTISMQSAARSVVSHMMLIHNDPKKPTVGSARGVLSHGSEGAIVQRSCYVSPVSQRDRRPCIWQSCLCT